MSTNDRDDVTKKLIKQMAARQRRSQDLPQTIVDGMSEPSRTDLENKFGGRVTGGEGGVNAR